MSWTDTSAPRCDAEYHCVTCGDDGVPMRVLEVDHARGLALCATAEDEQHGTAVETALVEHVCAGDALLVHAGVALLRLEDHPLGQATT